MQPLCGLSKYHIKIPSSTPIIRIQAPFTKVIRVHGHGFNDLKNLPLRVIV